MAENESGNEPEDRTVVDIRLERVHEENQRLQSMVEQLQGELDEVRKDRDRSNATMEYEERGKMRDALRVMGCTYSAEELDRMSLDQLDSLKRHYTHFKPLPFKSSADVSGSRKSIYDSLDEVYVPLEERKRKMQEA